MSEHRVHVDNGKYTFVVADGGSGDPGVNPEIDILRQGRPWMGHPLGNCAIHAAMRELDAARLVLRTVRDYVDAPDRLVPSGIVAALRRHDQLVADRCEPSDWCGGFAGRASPWVVVLNYFESSGRHYSSGQYETQVPVEDLIHPRGARAPVLYKIFEEVERIKSERKLPGLREGHSDYTVLVDVPGHPHRYPQLLLASELLAPDTLDSASELLTPGTVDDPGRGERDDVVRALLDALASPDGRNVAAAWERATILYGRFGTVMKRYAFEQYLDELATPERSA